MLKELVTSEIRKKFPEMEIEFGGKDEKVVATIRPIHASWKPIVVIDDGNEVTVIYGEFTHSHYKSYQRDATAEQKARMIAREVVEELAMVFDDKIEFWRSGSSNGMGPTEPQVTVSRGHAGFPTVLWSGKTFP